MSVTTTAFAAGQAITITGPAIASTYGTGAVVENVIVRGVDVTTDCWLNGARLVDLWYPQARNLTLQGLDDISTPFDMVEGLRMVRCQGVVIREIYAQHLMKAIYENETTFGEGIDISGGELVGIDIGIDIGGSAINKIAGTTIGPIHINAYSKDIKVRNHLQTNFKGGLYYKPGQSTQDWVGIELIDCGNITLNSITFAGNAGATGGNNAIVMTNTNNCLVDDISTDFFYQAGSVVLLTGSSDLNTLRADSFDVGVNGTIMSKVGVSALTGNLNRISGGANAETALAANDTTPSVGNALTGMFNTANSSATTISTFDDGYLMQEVEILVNDANTTFGHGSGISLQGEANYAAGSGAIMRFRNYGGVWREISRRTA